MMTVVDSTNDFETISVFDLRRRQVALTRTDGSKLLGTVVAVREGRGHDLEVRVKTATAVFYLAPHEIEKIIAL